MLKCSLGNYKYFSSTIIEGKKWAAKKRPVPVLDKNGALVGLAEKGV